MIEWCAVGAIAWYEVSPTVFSALALFFTVAPTTFAFLTSPVEAAVAIALACSVGHAFSKQDSLSTIAAAVHMGAVTYLLADGIRRTGLSLRAASLVAMVTMLLAVVIILHLVKKNPHTE